MNGRTDERTNGLKNRTNGRANGQLNRPFLTITLPQTTQQQRGTRVTSHSLTFAATSASSSARSSSASSSSSQAASSRRSAEATRRRRGRGISSETAATTPSATTPGWRRRRSHHLPVAFHGRSTHAGTTARTVTITAVVSAWASKKRNGMGTLGIV